MDKPKTFTCKEQNCGKEILYVYEPVDAVVKITKNPISEPKVVYLTCENGHTYPYSV
jgi:hypothetical protein